MSRARSSYFKPSTKPIRPSSSHEEGNIATESLSSGNRPKLASQHANRIVKQAQQDINTAPLFAGMRDNEEVRRFMASGIIPSPMQAQAYRRAMDEPLDNKSLGATEYLQGAYNTPMLPINNVGHWNSSYSQLLSFDEQMRPILGKGKTPIPQQFKSTQEFITPVKFDEESSEGRVIKKVDRAKEDYRSRLRNMITNSNLSDMLTNKHKKMPVEKPKPKTQLNSDLFLRKERETKPINHKYHEQNQNIGKYVQSSNPFHNSYERYSLNNKVQNNAGRILTTLGNIDESREGSLQEF